MKKLLFFLLLLPCLVKAQQTVWLTGVPTGTTSPTGGSFSPTWRTIFGTDSLSMKVFIGVNSTNFYQAYTATQSNYGFLRNQTHQSQPFNYWMTGTGEIDNNNLGAAITPVFSILNKTAATNVLNQNSGEFILGGNGWGGSSQSVRFGAVVVPINGTSAPDGSLNIYSNINNTGNTLALQISAFGSLGFNNFVVNNGKFTGNNDASGGIARGIWGNNTLYQTADNDVLANGYFAATFNSSSGLATVTVSNGGSLYTNGTYINVPIIDLTTGNHSIAGTALATVVISGGAIVSITPTTFGARYGASDNLTVAASDVGGTGSGLVAAANTLHTYSGGSFLDLYAATHVRFPGLQSITAVNGLGIDASGNIGPVTLPSTISASNGVVDSLGVIQLSTGTSNYLTKNTRLKDANGTVSLWMIPSNTNPTVEIDAVNSGANTAGQLVINGSLASINYVSSAGASGLQTDATGIFFSDPLFSIGAQYPADYSTNQRLQVNSVPSVKTVKLLADSTVAVYVPSQTGNSGKVLGTNGTATSWVSAGGSGTVTAVTGTTNRITSTGGTTPAIDISATFEALLGKVANPLSQFASTTSAQLAGVLSDESGTGVFALTNSPTFVTPALGTPSSGVGTNITGVKLSNIVGMTANNSIPLNGHQLNFGTSNNGLQIDDTGNTIDFFAGNGTTGAAVNFTATDANMQFFNASFKEEAIDFTSAGAVFTSQVALSNPTVANNYDATVGLNTLVTKRWTDSVYSVKAGSSSITTVGTLSVGSIPYSLLTGTPTMPTGANPSASAGTTAVNGSATTFMRSDGAPKVDSTAFATKALILTYLPKASIVSTYAPLSGNLSQFASTTSAQLRTVLSDESGTGAAIFAGGAIGAATATSINGITITSSTGTLTVGTGTLALANGISFTVDGIGQTTLVAGTKAVSITGVTTSSRAYVTLVAQGGTSTTVYQYKAVCTSGTVTISAESISGVLVNTDTSTLNYLIIN